MMSGRSIGDSGLRKPTEYLKHRNFKNLHQVIVLSKLNSVAVSTGGRNYKIINNAKLNIKQVDCKKPFSNCQPLFSNISGK